MATPKMAGHGHLTLVIPKHSKTHFLPGKRTPILQTLAVEKKIRPRVGANKVPVGNYNDYLSTFIQAAISAQSRHPGDNIRGLWPPLRDVTGGPGCTAPGTIRTYTTPTYKYQ